MTDPVVVVTPEKSRKVEALILRIQRKTERAIEQLTVFRDSLDDVENRTNDIRRDFDMIRPSKHDVEEERDKLNEVIHLDHQEGLHWITLKHLDHVQAELSDLHHQCQVLCNQITQGENSTGNFQRAKNLAPFPHQHLSILGIPSIFEFIENVNGIQSSQGIFSEGCALHKSLIKYVLEALMEHEGQCVQDQKPYHQS